MYAEFKVDLIDCPVCKEQTELIIKSDDNSEPFIENSSYVHGTCESCKAELKIRFNYQCTVEAVNS